MTVLEELDSKAEYSPDSLLSSRMAMGWFCTAHTVSVKAFSERSANSVQFSQAWPNAVSSSVVSSPMTAVVSRSFLLGQRR